MALIDSLNSCFETAKRKGWDRTYIAVDLHDTVITGTYRTDELPTDFLPNAKETLQFLSKHPNVVLIMYTCSHPAEIEKYFEFFKSHDIHFKYANKNPEVPNNALGCYTDKVYFNLLLDDKSCFNGKTEWPIIHDFFKNKFIL